MTAAFSGTNPPQPQSLSSRLTATPTGPRQLDGTFTAPANVPPPPVEASGKKMLAPASDLDERAIKRSGAVFHYRLGQAHFAQGRSSAARQEFLAALATDPDNALPLYYLGRLEEDAGRTVEARRAYERYLARIPNGEFRAEATTRIQHLKN
jgi:tetratricopeptide (TPR) repeat protein